MLPLNRQQGITVLELLIALIVAGILASFAIASYGSGEVNCDDPDAKQGPLVRARIGRASAAIGEIHLAVSKFELANGRFPVDLAEVGMDQVMDPWGNPYQYMIVEGLGNVGAVRKDHNLKPVNRFYDLYSMGPDGVTASPFTSTLGKDDIVLAFDGDYMGLACQFNGSGKN